MSELNRELNNNENNENSLINEDLLPEEGNHLDGNKINQPGEEINLVESDSPSDNSDNNFITIKTKFEQNRETLTERINMMNDELNQEELLSNTLTALEQNLDSEIDKMNKFLNDNEVELENMFNNVESLNKQLRDIVPSNKNREKELNEQNTVLNQLVSSEKFVKLSNNMKNINNTVTELEAFLKEQGVLGKNGIPIL